MAEESMTSAPGASYSGPGRREFGYSPFLPLLLLVIAVAAWPVFQCYQLINEKQGLATVYANQARQFEEAGKLRASLDSLARETAILADKGNPGAKLIVGELAKRGVTINPNAAPATADKAAK
jgi:hypothetical protein